MDETAAREVLAAGLAVPRETMERLDRFATLIREENQRQNLVSAGSLDQLWNRHILDSAQLMRFAPANGEWLDMGTGAGFPGVIVAMLYCGGAVTLVEQRRRRAEFLEHVLAELGLTGGARVLRAKIETIASSSFATISARAFAPLNQLLALGERFAALETRWLLPKGRNAETELAAARSSWQGDFRLDPSLTDPDARILVAERVKRSEDRCREGKGLSRR